MKKDRQIVNLISWLGLKDVFQTFDDLDYLKLRIETEEIRELINDSTVNEEG